MGAVGREFDLRPRLVLCIEWLFESDRWDETYYSQARKAIRSPSCCYRRQVFRCSDYFMLHPFFASAIVKKQALMSFAD
jgi:hypothetical protein